MRLTAEQRQTVKKLIDQKARERATDRYNCDPEYLTQTALEFESIGLPHVANVIRRFRDEVVNALLGEGWTIEKIEDQMVLAMAPKL